MVGARFAYLAALLAVVVCVEGCGGGGVPYEERAAWRDKTEAQCLAAGYVRASAYVQNASRVSGPSACGIGAALKVSGLNGGRVAVSPPATVNCPLTASLDRWMQSSVQKAAHRQFGQPVVGMRQIASYSCRGRNGSRRGHLSEHAYGNAIDIAAFRLANGREITVVKGWWRGDAREKAFLREVFTGACAEFYTVLGPGSDRYHYNHIHVDLLVTNVSKGRHYCRPVLRDGLFAAAEGDALSTASIKPIPFVGPPGGE
ncbi:MAG: extensin family protein [Methyloceanibacter sp.]|uniref:extensin-like domain-containing protein n=1 Tax=Methyloceanibacter sp. TaxID=1965321 RepID=UPI003D6D3E39